MEENMRMKNFLILFSALMLFLFVSCEQEELPNPEQTQVPPFDEWVDPDAPVVIIKGEVASVPCPQGQGEGASLKASVEAVLNEEGFLEIYSSNKDHQGAFTITVDDSAIPAHTHGPVEVPFTVSDSTGLSVEKTVQVVIVPNEAPSNLKVVYNKGNEPMPIHFGESIRLYIDELLTDSEYFTIESDNPCAASGSFSLSTATAIPTVKLTPAGETAEQDFPIWFKAQERGTITGFIVVDSTGAQSEPINVPIVVLQNDQPPVLTLPDAETKVFPQNYAFENYTDEEKTALTQAVKTFLADNGAAVESVDPVVSLENATIAVVSEPDRTKLGVQRLRVTAADSAGNVSAPVSVRVEYTVSDDFDFTTLPAEMNLLRDPGFEKEAVDFTGSGGDDFAQYRLSSAWTLEPTAIYLKRDTVGEGGSSGVSDASWTKAATDNSADTAQGPILLNTEQSWFLEQTKPVRDNGYSDVSNKNNMSTLPTDDMKHRLVYKAPSSEKANSGTYSLALRGKSYQPVAGSSLFLGTGVKLTQPVALSAGKSYVISSAIIRSFGRDEGNNLNGMVGGIYVMLKEGDTVLSEIQIVGHGEAAQYGQFVTYVGDPYAADADKEAVFEFRRYLSNDDGTKEDIDSTWGYSPIYIDDCAVYEIDAHIPEAEQIAAEALESEAQTLIGEGGGQ